MVFVVWLFRPYRHHSHIIVVGIINVVVASSCWVVGVDGAGGGVLGISNKKRIGGGGRGIPVHHTALHCHLALIIALPITLPSPSSPVHCCHWWWWWWLLGLGCGAWCWWCIMVVVVVCGLNEPNVKSSLGDTAHHVIKVGTCCSNQNN